MLIASIKINLDDYPCDNHYYIHRVQDKYYYSESSNIYSGISIVYISEVYTIGQSIRFMYTGKVDREYHWKNIDSIGGWLVLTNGYDWVDMNEEMKEKFLDMTWDEFIKTSFPTPLHMSITMTTKLKTVGEQTEV